MLGAVTETESLKQTIEILESICNPQDINEIIISYSPHRTKKCAQTIDKLMLAEYPIALNVFEQEKPFMAGIEGMIQATKSSHCILLPSDMAMDLNCVNEMVKMAKKSPDTIISCSRFLKGCKLFDYGNIKKFINKCAQFYMRILFGVRLTDFTNPCQIAPAYLYKSIRFESVGFPFLLEMVLKPLRLGYKFIEIPTNCYPRKDGKSRNSFRQMSSYLHTSLHIRFMKKSKILK